MQRDDVVAARIGDELRREARVAGQRVHVHGDPTRRKPDAFVDARHLVQRRGLVPQRGRTAHQAFQHRDAAVAKLASTKSTSFTLDLAKWHQIMQAYLGGGHAYHSTMPTDSLSAFRDTLLETRDLGFADLRTRQEDLGRRVRGMLGQRGFIDAMRGRNGGMHLARDPKAINVGDVFRAFESDLPFAECFSGQENHCPLTDCCWLRPALQRAVDAFYHSLDALTLADLVAGNADLDQLLTLRAVRKGGRMTLCAAGPAAA